ncbi:MAG: hypothetical protein KJ062_01730 [Thermoanaerobaculia bacterium]|nr:hypothetical protein [Thermoanaerobaculia bacterium]
MRALDALALAASLLLAPVVLAQGAADTLRFGAPSGTGPFTVPITLGDLAGTPLGVDRPAGERIQAFAVTVRFEPAAAVASATLSRAGLLASRTPAFETTASGAGTITWVGSFDEAEGAIPFTQPPGTGDTVLSLAVTLAPGATASASLDPATTTLSNQAGTTSESADGGTLALGPPVLLPTAGTTAPPVPAPGFAGLLALAAATAAAGAALSRRA